MKKTIIGLVAACVLFLGVTTAYAWHAHANVRVTSTYVEASVVNRKNVPVYCNGFVYGRTYNGNVYRNYTEGVVAPFGGWGVVGVRTHSNDPFVAGWADINCRY